MTPKTRTVWLGAVALTCLAITVIIRHHHAIVEAGRESTPQTPASHGIRARTDHEQGHPTANMEPRSPVIQYPVGSLPSDNPELARFLDRSRTDRVTADISSRLPLLTDPAELASVAHVVTDGSEDDAVRNEAMNLLARCEYATLADLVLAVLDNPVEQARFRAFATQRLGMLAAPDERTVIAPLAARLRVALGDRHLEVRREALLALARIHDTQAIGIVRRGLNDPAWADARDLIIRCLHDLDERSSRVDIRRFLPSTREQERIAALYVLGEWQDRDSSPAFAEAAADVSNPRIRRAGLRAQGRLREGDATPMGIGEPE